jgi:hypothetical protein
MELPPLPFDPYAIALGGFSLIPTIVFLIQIAKSFFPNAIPDFWRVSALVLGVLGAVGAFHDQNALPVTVGGWIALFITGLVVGRLATAGYDQTLRDRKPVIYQSMDPAFGSDFSTLSVFDLNPSIPVPGGGAITGGVVEVGEIEADEKKTEPLNVGKHRSDTSDFSEG